MEHVRYELTDLVVSNMRSIDEHKTLMSNWDAMMDALGRSRKGKPNEHRKEAVRQRVLLRIIAAAAEMEISSANIDTVVADCVDPDLEEIRRANQSAAPAKKKQKATESSHESLTLSLLGALPSLLDTYKSEPAILESLTGLPQFFRT